MVSVSNKVETGNQPIWAIGKDVSAAVDVRDALSIAGLGWGVSKEACRANDGTMSPCGKPGTFPVEGAFFTVRDDKPLSDPNRIISCVGAKYTCIQNSNGLGLGDELRATGSVRFGNAGIVGNGRVCYLTAHLPEPMTVNGGKLATTLVIKTTHDGSGCLVVSFSVTNPSCSNELAMIARTAASQVSIPHTATAAARIEQARKVLQSAQGYFDATEKRLNQYTQVATGRAFVEAYLRALIPDPAKASPTRAENQRFDIAKLFVVDQPDAQVDGMKGTAYGLVNAVTHYAQHGRALRAAGRNEGEARLASVAWGSAAKFRARAYSLMDSAIGADGSVSLVKVAHEEAADILVDSVAPTSPSPSTSKSETIDDVLGALDLN